MLLLCVVELDIFAVRRVFFEVDDGATAQKRALGAVKPLSPHIVS